MTLFLGERIDVLKDDFVCIYRVKRFISLGYSILVSCVFYTGQLNLETLYNFSDRSKRCIRYFALFYVYGSVHHNIFHEITNRCSYMQSILFYS